MSVASGYTTQQQQQQRGLSAQINRLRNLGRTAADDDVAFAHGGPVQQNGVKILCLFLCFLFFSLQKYIRIKKKKKKKKQRWTRSLEERRVALLERLARKNTELEIGQSKMISDLAYSAGQGKTDTEAANSVEKKRADYIREFAAAVAKGETGNVAANGLQLDMLRRNLEYLQGMKVVDANRDAVAIKGADGRTTFGFRGTAQLRDLIPDAQLAFNSDKVGRLEEAKKFVDSVTKRERMQNKDLRFVGHSLGGFIAEGVRNQYVGSQATTFASGAPMRPFIGKDKKVNAWGTYDKAAEDKFDRDNNIAQARITRVVRHGDLVSGSINSGAAVNGRANLYQLQRTKKGQLNPLDNHFLRADAASTGTASVDATQGGVLVADYFNNDLKRGAVVEGVERPQDSSLLTRLKGAVDKIRYKKVVEKAVERPNGRVVKWGRTYKVDRLQGVKDGLSNIAKKAQKAKNLVYANTYVAKQKALSALPRWLGGRKPRKQRTVAEVLKIKERWQRSRARANRRKR